MSVGGFTEPTDPDLDEEQIEQDEAVPDEEREVPVDDEDYAVGAGSDTEGDSLGETPTP